MHQPSSNNPAKRVTSFLAKSVPDDDSQLPQWVDKFNDVLDTKVLYKQRTMAQPRDEAIWQMVRKATDDVADRITGELRDWVLEHFPELSEAVKRQEKEFALARRAGDDEATMQATKTNEEVNVDEMAETIAHGQVRVPSKLPGAARCQRGNTQDLTLGSAGDTVSHSSDTATKPDEIHSQVGGLERVSSPRPFRQVPVVYLEAIPDDPEESKWPVDAR
ncbi:uncharacterized protein B0H18DRAFT_1119720 [Fomitopsis serialis]|uniref:uncharacterized protein n=1 Tax=Fomitopsis serialis TaxID=139415 RepID=UPI002007A340|nr:uncharacterized protein B0H18DRAFT_1119720 [Neoantrodia serialis]KAH9924931.1 hypothetical protein B0H18DRAFT_1119720 [Neoantrodia serialis]